MKYFSFVIIILLLSNCDPKPDPIHRIEMVDLTPPSEYELLEYRYEFWFGESLERYKLKISKKEYIRLSNEIRNEKKAVYYDTIYDPPTKYMDRNYIDINEIEKYKLKRKKVEFAYWNEKEVILKSIVSFDEMIVLRLEKDTILFINYDED